MTNSAFWAGRPALVTALHGVPRRLAARARSARPRGQGHCPGAPGAAGLAAGAMAGPRRACNPGQGRRCGIASFSKTRSAVMTSPRSGPHGHVGRRRAGHAGRARRVSSLDHREHMAPTRHPALQAPRRSHGPCARRTRPMARRSCPIVRPRRSSRAIRRRSPKLAQDLLTQSFGKVYDLNVAVTRCGNFGPRFQLHTHHPLPAARCCAEGERPVLRSDGRFVATSCDQGRFAPTWRWPRLSPPARSCGGGVSNFPMRSGMTVIEIVERGAGHACLHLEPIVGGPLPNVAEIPKINLSCDKALGDAGLDRSPSFDEASLLQPTGTSRTSPGPNSRRQPGAPSRVWRGERPIQHYEATPLGLKTALRGRAPGRRTGLARYHLGQQAAPDGPKSPGDGARSRTTGPGGAAPGPTMGSMSGRDGRRRAKSSLWRVRPREKLAADVSAAPSCTGVGGASRLANSTPVVAGCPPPRAPHMAALGIQHLGGRGWRCRRSGNRR